MKIKLKSWTARCLQDQLWISFKKFHNFIFFKLDRAPASNKLNWLFYNLKHTNSTEKRLLLERVHCSMKAWTVLSALVFVILWKNFFFFAHGEDKATLSNTNTVKCGFKDFKKTAILVTAFKNACCCVFRIKRSFMKFISFGDGNFVQEKFYLKSRSHFWDLSHFVSFLQHFSQL